MNENRWALFPGRFQPLHLGHCTIIRNILNTGQRVLVLMMDEAGMDRERNPYTTDERIEMFKREFPDELAARVLAIVVIPAFDSVVYGRDVGYQFKEMRLAPEIEAINATEIRATQ